ncbi:hypothetical protein EVAR_7171_1 [Eumeta japonica]|uniref:Uncharacterized protein n=1 Tax=Eumeta variegata TaxID=151549 RepID=A0A4C1U6G8_EUMVA|nr:hypothetical protein EVAR_7171_1 [Eumeta japonica]
MLLVTFLKSNLTKGLCEGLPSARAEPGLWADIGRVDPIPSLSQVRRPGSAKACSSLCYFAFILQSVRSLGRSGSAYISSDVNKEPREIGDQHHEPRSARPGLSPSSISIRAPGSPLDGRLCNPHLEISRPDSILIVRN